MSTRCKMQISSSFANMPVSLPLVLRANCSATSPTVRTLKAPVSIFMLELIYLNQMSRRSCLINLPMADLSMATKLPRTRIPHQTGFHSDRRADLRKQSLQNPKNRCRYANSEQVARSLIVHLPIPHLLQAQTA